MNLEPTGERLVVDRYQSSQQDWLIYLMHAATYAFAQSYVTGKRVLDYGTGSGWGADRIAETAQNITGVDVAEDAIAHANAHYRRDNLAFQLVDPNAPLPFADGSFDVVMSFQVIEHVHDVDFYLSEIRRVLASGGIVLMATPDRSTRLLPWQRPWNRWHVREYSARALRQTLSRYFADTRLLRMSGPRSLIDVELKRCRTVRWVTLPLTLPFVPDRVRVAGLTLLHRLRGNRLRNEGGGTWSGAVKDIVIEPQARPSLNLIAVAECGVHQR